MNRCDSLNGFMVSDGTAAQNASVLLVYDNLGKQILSRQVGKVYQGQELLDTRKLPDGMYIYQMVQDGKVVSDGKFIVTH